MKTATTEERKVHYVATAYWLIEIHKIHILFHFVDVEAFCKVILGYYFFHFTFRHVSKQICFFMSRVIDQGTDVFDEWW
jgi:hypothetical protein